MSLSCTLTTFVVERLNEAGYVVVMAEIPDGNLSAVMLYQHGATPYPARDVFLHLAFADSWPSLPEARGLDILPSVRTQAKTIDEALGLAAREAGVR